MGKPLVRVSYTQRYLFNANPATNHNANPTNPTDPILGTVVNMSYDTLN